jgi:hypothetical protein
MEDVGVFIPFFLFYCQNGIFYGHLEHFVFIWYIFPFLVCSTEKNLATMIRLLKILLK